MSDRRPIDDFIADSLNAPTPEALFTCFTRAVGRFGYDRITFSVFDDPDLPDQMQTYGLHRLNLDAWWKDYQARNLVRIDPLIKAVRSGAGIFAWNDLKTMMPLTRAQGRFLADFANLGIHNGVAIPLNRNRAAIGLSTSVPTGASHPDLPRLGAIATQFYFAYKRLHERPRETLYLSPLSNKEQEILAWVAAGKTDSEVAAILSVSPHTVASYMCRIYQKLGAHNRVVAVVKAIGLGVLTV